MAQQDTLGIFTGGQMTDLPIYPGPLLGDELMEVVAPGNAAFGINYSMTALQLTQFLIGFIANPTIVTDTRADNPASPWVPPTTTFRALMNKAIAAPSFIQLGLASTYTVPILIKDLKGDADVNPITVTFSGGETMDGLTEVVINNAFGYFWFNPLKAGNWYDAAF